jgi:hypothetical protein
MSIISIKKDFDGEDIVVYDFRIIKKELVDILAKYKRIMFIHLFFNDIKNNNI